MPRIPDKIHLKDLPSDPRASNINWKILSPRAKRHAKKMLKEKRQIAKERAEKR